MSLAGKGFIVSKFPLAYLDIQNKGCIQYMIIY